VNQNDDTSLSGIAGIGTAGKNRGGFAIRSGDGGHIDNQLKSRSCYPPGRRRGNVG